MARMKVCFGILFFYMLAACQHPNKFHDARLQQLMAWQDERNGNQLLKFLEDEDPEFRAQAAIGLSYINDKQSILALLKRAEIDPEATVREAAFFSLGQLKGDSVGSRITDLFSKEESENVKHAILIAASKCGQSEWLKQKGPELSKEYPAYYAEALFYLARRGDINYDFKSLLIGLLKEDESCFYAASAIARSSILLNVADVKAIQEIIAKADDNELLPLYAALSKAGTKAFEILNSGYLSDTSQENYLLRLAILKAVKSFPADTAAIFYDRGLIDVNFHVREMAAEWCAGNDAIPTKRKIDVSLNEKYPRTKYYLLQSLIRFAEKHVGDSISAEIKLQYKREKDPYTQGYQLKALAADFDNFEFIEEETFSSPAIIVREAGFEALLGIRSDKRFPDYAMNWNKSSANISLEQHFASVFRNAIETEDVAMISLAAAFLRDTTLPGYAKGTMPVPYEDISFMKKVIEKIHLPRDIEAFGELLKTIRLYEGKPTEGTQKPDFNNPIDWEIVERIPDDQEIEIVTSEGVIRLELWVNEAPGTVGQFVKLIKEGFYSDKRIHRVVPGFVIQDGCPRGDGYGSSEQTIRSEFSSRNYEPGTLGMASSGVDTESCQWFITHAPTPHLNGRYTAFGKVIEGMEVVHKLAVGAEVKEIRLVGNF